MAYNWFVEIIMWLAGVLHVLGCIGGLAFVVFGMIWLKRHPEVNHSNPFERNTK